jgi:hypothetical protein
VWVLLDLIRGVNLPCCKINTFSFVGGVAFFLWGEMFDWKQRFDGTVSKACSSRKALSPRGIVLLGRLFGVLL